MKDRSNSKHILLLIVKVLAVKASQPILADTSVRIEMVRMFRKGAESDFARDILTGIPKVLAVMASKRQTCVKNALKDSKSRGYAK